MHRIAPFIEQWQTLIAGVLAIAAAIVGGWFVLLQTRSAQRQHEDTVDRQHDADRAMLPSALDTMMFYANGCLDELFRLRSLSGGGRVPTDATPHFPDTPRDAVAEIRALIGSSRQKLDRAAYSSLLRLLQIQSARIKGITRSGSRTSASELETFIIDTAEIHAICAALFPYARMERDHPNVKATAQEYCSALSQNGFDSEHDASIFEAARARQRRRSL